MSDIQGWSVTVNINAEDVLTISDQHVAGVEITDEIASVVRTAAKHLLSFVGNGLDRGGGAVILATEAEMPVEFLDVARVIESGDGRWKSCSGCHETEDGHPTQRYHFSTFLRCEVGVGCSECGGIGAVWDDYSMYEQIVDEAEGDV